MKTPKLKTVVTKAPGQAPVAVQVENIDYDFLKTAVGGFIEAVPFASTTLTLWCNEEGKLDGLSLNVFNNADIIAGSCVITGGATPAGNTRGLTPKQAEIAIQILWNMEYRG